MCVYLNVAVQTNGWVVGPLQALEGDGPLLLVVDEEDEEAAGEVQQHAYRGALSDATVRPTEPTQQKSRQQSLSARHVTPVCIM